MIAVLWLHPIAEAYAKAAEVVALDDSIDFELNSLPQQIPPESGAFNEIAGATNVAITHSLPPKTAVAANEDSSSDEPQASTESGKYRLSNLKQDFGEAKWGVAGFAGAITATRIIRLVKNPGNLTIEKEGWFGRDTESLGMDKLHHAYKTYVIADILQSMIVERTGERQSAVNSGAIVGFGLMTYAELLDGFTDGHGWSHEDNIMHAAGAAFSILRGSVPGMREKVDFRMEIKPSFKGNFTQLNNQLDDRKYLLALQFSGFPETRDTPLRFAELHFGYYARGFSERERARGAPLKRKLYVGVGINVQQLLFGREKPKSRVGRLGYGVLDYIQVPYTSAVVN